MGCHQNYSTVGENEQTGLRTLPKGVIIRNMKPDLTPYLGKPVSVVIDRPLGSRHPQHLDIVYTVNYGYLPDTKSGDGMPIDIYLLGVDEPVVEAEGTVIAVIVRSGDTEDKLVVAPGGEQLTIAEIETLVAFQERYFASRIVMMSDE